MKKFIKKCINNWEEVLYLALLTVVFLFSVLIAGIQDDYLFKTFVICMAISCIGLSISTFVGIVKTFKVDNKLPNGKWKVQTLTFWLDIISMLSIVAAYLLIALGMLLTNIALVNICVICLGVHLLSILTKIILFTVQNKKRFKGEGV